MRSLIKMSPPDDFVSSDVEITSSTSLETTDWNEKELIVMYLPFIFFTLVWFLYLLTILLIRSASLASLNDSEESGDPRDNVMD